MTCQGETSASPNPTSASEGCIRAWDPSHSLEVAERCLNLCPWLVMAMPITDNDRLWIHETYLQGLRIWEPSVDRLLEGMGRRLLVVHEVAST